MHKYHEIGGGMGASNKGLIFSVFCIFWLHSDFNWTYYVTHSQFCMQFDSKAISVYKGYLKRFDVRFFHLKTAELIQGKWSPNRGDSFDRESICLTKVGYFLKAKKLSEKISFHFGQQVVGIPSRPKRMIPRMILQNLNMILVNTHSRSWERGGGGLIHSFHFSVLWVIQTFTEIASKNFKITSY